MLRTERWALDWFSKPEKTSENQRNQWGKIRQNIIQ